jgi:hypothetical protein
VPVGQRELVRKNKERPTRLSRQGGHHRLNSRDILGISKNRLNPEGSVAGLKFASPELRQEGVERNWR